MRRRLLHHVRDQWMGMLALWLVLAGGTAYALDGANTVFTDDIVDGEVRTADLRGASVTTNKLAEAAVTTAKIAQEAVTSDDLRDRGINGVDIALEAVDSNELRDGGVKGVDIGDNAVAGEDIADGAITSADIDESKVNGLDRCPDGTQVFRRLCLHFDDAARDWIATGDYCTSRGLRLPSVSELRGIAIANLLDVGPDDRFWADDLAHVSSSTGNQLAYYVRGSGAIQNEGWGVRLDGVVCVTTPQN